MKINTFLIFPEGDDALAILDATATNYIEIVNILIAIKKKLKSDFNYTLYYDAQNITNFLAAASDLVPENICKQLKGQIQFILKSCSSNINTPHFRQAIRTYSLHTPPYDLQPANFIVSEATELSLLDNVHNKTCCLSFSESHNTERENIYVIIDEELDILMPKMLALKAFSDDIGIVKFLLTCAGNGFSLENNPSFTPLSKRRKKQRIYLENNTGNHWYFDYYHKDNKIHYEVFNSTGKKHLGEADLNGLLQPDTDDDEKKIDHIL